MFSALICLKKSALRLCFGKIFLLGIEFYVDSFFFYYFNNVASWCILLHCVCCYPYVLFHIMYLFTPLAIFYIFSLSLILNNLIMMCFSVVFLILFNVGFVEFLEYAEFLSSLKFKISIKFENFLIFISSNIFFCHALSFLTFEDSNYTYKKSLKLC